MSALGRAAGWMFRSRITGAITIAQWPNLPLWLFLALYGASRILGPTHAGATALRIAALLALGWWAADEILRGVNPWRRLLGVTVLAGLALTGLRGAAGLADEGGSSRHGGNFYVTGRAAIV